MATKKKVSKKKVNNASEASPVVGVGVSREYLEGLDHEGVVMFARLNYGLAQISTKSNPKEEIVDIIMNAARKFQGNSEMSVHDMNTADVEVPPGYVKIRVQSGENNPNKRPIPIGLNFRMATIPVNKDVVMPDKWLPCLEDAVQTRYFIDKSDPNNETLGWMEQHSYPFSILERG
jgi:hypothetical protein